MELIPARIWFITSSMRASISYVWHTTDIQLIYNEHTAGIRLINGWPTPNLRLIYDLKLILQNHYFTASIRLFYAGQDFSFWPYICRMSAICWSYIGHMSAVSAVCQPGSSCMSAVHYPNISRVSAILNLQKATYSVSSNAMRRKIWIIWFYL